MVWKPQKLPPLQEPKPKRDDQGPSPFARIVAAIAGIAFGVSAVLSLYKALQDKSGQSSPFAALAMLLPAGVLIRYAITGQIKM